MARQRSANACRRQGCRVKPPWPSNGGCDVVCLAHSDMVDVLVLLPDFSLIVLGWLLCRFTPLNRSVWDGVERLVYVVLFPVLLFGSIARHPTSLDALLSLGGVGLAIVGAGVLMAAALRAWPQRDPSLHASGQQIAYRFNSYLALALSERLAGAQGLA